MLMKLTIGVSPLVNFNNILGGAFVPIFLCQKSNIQTVIRKKLHKTKLGRISNLIENNSEFDRKSQIRNSNLRSNMRFCIKFNQN